MAVYQVYNSEIYSLFKKNIDFLFKNRDCQEELNCALNMNIILLTACYLEGLLERKAKCVLGYHRSIYKNISIPDLDFRRPMNIFYNRITSDLKRKISQTSGVDSYDSLFEVLLGKSMKKEVMIKPLIEPIKALFQLRNVIAHGREINAYEVNAYWTNGLNEEHFEGGYKKAENLLIKNKLLDKKYIQQQDVSLFFTNKIVDYFYNITNEFISQIDLFVSKNLEISNKIHEDVSAYNETYGTEHDLMSYFEMRGSIV